MEQTHQDILIKALGASPVALMVADESGKVRFVNNEFEKVFGFSSEEALGQNVGFIIPPQFRSDQKQNFKGIFAAPQTVKLGHHRLYYGLRRNGEQFPVEIDLSMIDQDGERFVVAVIADLTERMEVRRKHLTNQQRYEMSVIHSTDGIWDWFNIEEETQWWSPRFYEILGFDNRELKPTWENFKALVHPEDQERLSECLEKHLRKNLPLNIECRMKSKSLMYHWFRIKGRATIGKKGKSTRILGTAADIDQRKIAEIEKDDLKKFLAQKERLASIGEIVAGVTHHIKNILGGMITSMRIIEMALSENDLMSVKKAWSHYSRTSKRLSDFANEVLSLTRNPRLNNGPEDLIQLVRDVIEDCSDTAMVKEVTVDFHAYQNIPPVIMDSQGISDALLNLIGNAIDAASEMEHGMVNISVRSHIQKRSVEITITDNGKGIPEGMRETIFQPFYSSKSGQSSGLGLPMAKKVVIDHQGDIDFESRPGKTSFRVSLPVEPHSINGDGDPRLKASKDIYTPVS